LLGFVYGPYVTAIPLFGELFARLRPRLILLFEDFSLSQREV